MKLLCLIIGLLYLYIMLIMPIFLLFIPACLKMSYLAQKAMVMFDMHPIEVLIGGKSCSVFSGNHSSDIARCFSGLAR